MFGLLTIVSTLLATKGFIKEKLEKPAPKGARFDWDAYYKDIANGMSTMEQIKKRQRGGYITTKPDLPKWYELPIDAVIDTKRYEHDKATYGEYIAEAKRKNGVYRQIRNF